MRGIRTALKGKRIQQVHINRPDLRRPFPSNLKMILMRAKVQEVRRRAKYILIDLDNNWTVLIHLGMSGRLFIDKASDAHELRKHQHFDFLLNEGTRIALVDPRRFGMVDAFPSPPASEPPFMKRLGIEPLGEEPLTPITIRDLFEKTHSPIKNALLDQTKIVGLGNIYVCEALFRAGIHPQKTANALSQTEYERLSHVIPEILREALAAGGSTLRDYVTADGQKGSFQELHQVYGRAGESCPICAQKKRKALITKITQSGRSTFFCPQHQKSEH